jgi:hypothetical protein
MLAEYLHSNMSPALLTGNEAKDKIFGAFYVEERGQSI